MSKKLRSRVSETTPILQIRGLHAYYGHSHALQGVNLSFKGGVFAVVGRNGMGKTTLCNSIMGLVASRTGSIRFWGEEILHSPPHRVATAGISYTPQGRRLWPSLTVEEHLRLFSHQTNSWNIERIYSQFPRLYERRKNRGRELSGGEQQMLSISRALLQNPELLILDEPTEGLAPVIVDQVKKLLSELANSGEMAILLIEQNVGVATSVSEQVAIMSNGRIERVMESKQLAADRDLQKRLFGVGTVASAETETEPATQSSPVLALPKAELPKKPLAEPEQQKENITYNPPTRWSHTDWRNNKKQAPTIPVQAKLEPLYKESAIQLTDLFGKQIYVVGTFDTKNLELSYMRDCIRTAGGQVKTVDLSTSGKLSVVDIPPHMVAAYHPKGASSVFTNDRGSAIAAMAESFVNWILQQKEIGGIVSAGGTGGTALATPAMRALPVGVPKIMVSTVASGDVRPYVGPTDIMMMNSVTDVQGLNQISRQVLANGAHAMVGMVKERNTEKNRPTHSKPSLGLTMFGVTTTAVQQITEQLEEHYECLVFHATGIGGQSMEKLVDSGVLSAVVDLTTTELCDMIVGGVFPATEDRLGAFIRTSIPYVGSVGAVDMVNFNAKETVPESFKGRTLVVHNPQITLMRTNIEENIKIGNWLVERLNNMAGPVRFLIPKAGVSALDMPDQPFYDPAANAALFETIKKGFVQTKQRRLIETPYHINDPAFTEIVIQAFTEINPIEIKKYHAQPI